MSQFTLSNQVLHRPWVGSNYSHRSQKILFLGESHYGVFADDGDKEFTSEMIRRQFGEGLDAGQEDDRYVLPSKIERMFRNQQELTAIRSREFWNEVAFYNFMQGYLATQKDRPTKDQFKNSVSPFCEVVCELKPDVVVVLGIGTWNNLPNNDVLRWERQLLDRVVKSPARKMKRSLELWRGSSIHINLQHDFWSFYIPHPSSIGFGSALSWAEWPRVALEAISLRK